jgi:hypothetical protein
MGVKAVLQTLAATVVKEKTWSAAICCGVPSVSVTWLA